MWISTTGWDDIIPIEINEKWIQIRSELNLINGLEIDRWIHSAPNTKRELIGFCDASQKAYGAVLYLRTITNCDVNMAIVMSKARVTPINKKRSPQLQFQNWN